MKYFLALFLLISSPAAAQEVQCFPAKKLITTMITGGYFMQVLMEVNHNPVYFFVNVNHDYYAIQYKNEKTACIIGVGTAFYILRERKA